MTARVCTCIRRERDARQIAVPDPDCGQHRHRHAHGNKPTLVIYDETDQADQDALRAAAALGRLITITTGLALITVGIVTATPGRITWATTAWIAGAGLIARIAYIASKEKP